MVDLAGVWSREWEEDPLGGDRDASTFVWWVQSGVGVYSDLRLPQESPGRHEALCPNPSALLGNGASKALKDFVKTHPEVLPSILNQKSFAGVLEQKDGDTTAGEAMAKDKELVHAEGDLLTCHWHRHIDYQPPTGGQDLGVCRREPPAADGSVFMRETGDDASYAEGWRCFAETKPCLALELVSENGREGLRKGYWVRAGSRFGYAVGRPLTEEACVAVGCPRSAAGIAHAVGRSLQEAVCDLCVDEQLDVAMSYLSLAGEIETEGFWRIRYSTNPELVGCHFLVDIGDDGRVVQTVDGATRTWQILERVD